MRTVRLGMAGGGDGGLIGAAHRAAAALDPGIQLVCGAFSSDPARSRRSGLAFGLPAERCYGDYDTLFSAEAVLPREQRIAFVTIVMPNLNPLPRGAGSTTTAPLCCAFAGGARDVLVASQICAGDVNDLTLRIYGDKAGL